MATSKSSKVPSMSSFSPTTAAPNLPRPSEPTFWDDVGPVGSASRLLSDLKKRRAAAALEKSTRKVSRASVVREARGGGFERGVDTNKRESKRKRLTKENEDFEDDDEGDEDLGFVGHFGEDAGLHEKERVVSFTPSPRIVSSKRVKMPTLPKGRVASKRTRRMEQKQPAPQPEEEEEAAMELEEVRSVDRRDEGGNEWRA